MTSQCSARGFLARLKLPRRQIIEENGKDRTHRDTMQNQNVRLQRLDSHDRNKTQNVIVIMHVINRDVLSGGENPKTVIDPRAFASRCTKETEESTQGKVPLMHRDPNDLGSMIRFRICQKTKGTLVWHLPIIFFTSTSCYACIKTDSVQSSGNACKNYLLKIYSQQGNSLHAIENISL